MKRIIASIAAAVLITALLGQADARAMAQSSPLPPGFTDPTVYANLIGVNPIPTAPAVAVHHAEPVLQVDAPTVARDDSDAGLSGEGRR